MGVSYGGSLSLRWNCSIVLFSFSMKILFVFVLLFYPKVDIQRPSRWGIACYDPECLLYVLQERREGGKRKKKEEGSN